ncbi:MAG TPA: tRNA (adenosine(37)-N6)-dimethylallyltransferase MiaA [Puia sp.]|nr:tRNA (adenosine(37)-N6)-dimethylallyltransferase MiaA [Puia sp.]
MKFIVSPLIFDEFFTSSVKLKNKTVIVILGPTAAGKTAAAIRLAQLIQTKIISADSRQCFRELSIGVAKPTEKELRSVHHYFINSHGIHEYVNAALFEQLALQYAQEIFRENDKLVMVGGTGLYIRAFCEGLDEIPVVEKNIREKIQKGYAQYGLGWLQDEIKKYDTEFYREGEILNPQRVMRALEVKLSTERSILSFHSTQKKHRAFNIIKVGLRLSREQLHRNINNRTEQMISNGLLQEVEQLQPYRHLNALKTVGYTELFDYVDKKISLDAAIELINKNTRQYAKRQMTWFKKDDAVTWVDPDELHLLKNITEP